MRLWKSIGPALLLALPAWGGDEPVLPLKIPGYELRVLDQRKPLRLGVAGTWLETSLPIFFYYPTADRIHALDLVHQAQESLQRLGAKQNWSAAELQHVLTDLNAALRLLGAEPAPPLRHP
jgi:hypothetical protein